MGKLIKVRTVTYLNRSHHVFGLVAYIVTSVISCRDNNTPVKIKTSRKFLDVDECGNLTEKKVEKYKFLGSNSSELAEILKAEEDHIKDIRVELLTSPIIKR